MTTPKRDSAVVTGKLLMFELLMANLDLLCGGEGGETYYDKLAESKRLAKRARRYLATLKRKGRKKP